MFNYTNVTLKASLYAAAMGLLFALPGYASPNLIVNGDFEAEPHDMTGSIANWTVSGTGNGATEMEGATSGDFSAALNVGSDTEGTVLSQSFGTVAGQGYLVEFDAGIFGTHSVDPLQLNVQVLGTGALLEETITPPEAGSSTPSSVIFHHYRYTFVANGDTTTLQFTDIKTGNGAADTLIDTVSVMEATLPPPTTLPLTNGDFETGPFDANGSVTGWSAMGASQIAATDESAPGGPHFAALGPGGDFQDDILSQSFFTTPGQTYAIDFDAGVFGTSDFTQMLRVRLLGNDGLLDQTLTPPYAETFDPGMVQFQHYHFEVTANSSVSTLEFSDLGLGNAFSDLLIDTVSVTQVGTPTPTPTPASPTLSTVAGGTVQLGTAAKLTDTATLSGGLNPTGTITFTLYDPSNVAVYTDVVTVNGNGSYDTSTGTNPGGYLPTATGTYLWTATYSGDSNNNAASDNGQNESETVIPAPTPTPSPTPTPPLTFVQWQGIHFTPAQQADPQISGWDADPDQDQIANGLEYFSNIDPLAGVTESDASSLPRNAIEISGDSPYLTYTYPRRIGWQGTPEIVAVSDDLVSWDETGNQLEPVSVIPSGDGITEIVKVRLATPIDQGPIQKKFLRLELTQ